MEELDLKELFNLFWSKKVQIIIIVLIFSIIGFIYTIVFTTPMYSSYTTLVLASSGNENLNSNTSITATEITINSKLVSTYSEIVKSKNILREVIQNLGIDIEEDTLRKNVSVNARKDTELIEITVRNEQAASAARIANEIAEVFMKKVKEIYSIDNVQIVDVAEISDSPSNINHVKDIIIFAFIGVVVSIGYVLISNMLDTTIKTVEDIEKEYDLPVLVSIPMIEDLGEERRSRR